MTNDLEEFAAARLGQCNYYRRKTPIPYLGGTLLIGMIIAGSGALIFATGVIILIEVIRGDNFRIFPEIIGIPFGACWAAVGLALIGIGEILHMLRIIARNSFR